MAIDEQIEKVKGQVHEWENELMELDQKAQAEIEQSGKTIRQKYDGQMKTIKDKITAAEQKLDDVV